MQSANLTLWSGFESAHHSSLILEQYGTIMKQNRKYETVLGQTDLVATRRERKRGSKYEGKRGGGE